MSREHSTEIRSALRSVDVGTRIAVNGNAPWEIVDMGEATDRDGRYLDTYWIAEEVDGNQQYRIWAHDPHRDRSPNYHEYHPNSWRADTGHTDITGLAIAGGDGTIVSDIVAADIVDDLR